MRNAVPDVSGKLLRRTQRCTVTFSFFPDQTETGEEHKTYRETDQLNEEMRKAGGPAAADQGLAQAQIRPLTSGFPYEAAQKRFPRSFLQGFLADGDAAAGKEQKSDEEREAQRQKNAEQDNAEGLQVENVEDIFLVF